MMIIVIHTTTYVNIESVTDVGYLLYYLVSVGQTEYYCF